VQAPAPSIPWSEIDTVLLDMDGTLLDLAFDNFFWRELVPSRFAALQGLPLEQVQREVEAQYRSVEGSLAWYCLDHWSRVLDIDLRALKWDHRHLISYLPRAPQFLARIRQRGKRALIVTNAHRETLAVKVAQTGLDTRVDGLVCSHDFSVPKENAAFWPALQRQEDLNPARTLLIEDSLPVLHAARAFGLGKLIAIRRPDSSQPAREIVDFPAIEGVSELI
jgi:GMP/IMP 5'-nucleotidase